MALRGAVCLSDSLEQVPDLRDVTIDGKWTVRAKMGVLGWLGISIQSTRRDRRFEAKSGARALIARLLRTDSPEYGQEGHLPKSDHPRGTGGTW